MDEMEIKRKNGGHRSEASFIYSQERGLGDSDSIEKKRNKKEREEIMRVKAKKEHETWMEGEMKQRKGERSAEGNEERLKE